MPERVIFDTNVLISGYLWTGPPRRALEHARGVNNLVYHYPFGAKDYYAVSGEVEGMAWLVIFGTDGIMETAFPPDDLADYLTKRGFVLLGRMEEITHE